MELMLLTSNLCIHLSKTQGFATLSLKIGPEGLVASDVSLCAVVPGLFWLADVDRRTDRFGFDVHQDQSFSHEGAAEEMQS